MNKDFGNADSVDQLSGVPALPEMPTFDGFMDALDEALRTTKDKAAALAKLMEGGIGRTWKGFTEFGRMVRDSMHETMDRKAEETAVQAADEVHDAGKMKRRTFTGSVAAGTAAGLLPSALSADEELTEVEKPITISDAARMIVEDAYRGSSAPQGLIATMEAHLRQSDGVSFSAIRIAEGLRAVDNLSGQPGPNYSDLSEDQNKQTFRSSMSPYWSRVQKLYNYIRERAEKGRTTGERINHYVYLIEEVLPHLERLEAMVGVERPEANEVRRIRDGFRNLGTLKREHSYGEFFEEVTTNASYTRNYLLGDFDRNIERMQEALDNEDSRPARAEAIAEGCADDIEDFSNWAIGRARRAGDPTRGWFDHPNRLQEKPRFEKYIDRLRSGERFTINNESPVGSGEAVDNGFAMPKDSLPESVQAAIEQMEGNGYRDVIAFKPSGMEVLSGDIQGASYSVADSGLVSITTSPSLQSAPCGIGFPLPYSGSEVNVRLIGTTGEGGVKLDGAGLFYVEGAEPVKKINQSGTQFSAGSAQRIGNSGANVSFGLPKRDYQIQFYVVVGRK